MPLTHVDLGDGEVLSIEEARARLARRDLTEDYTPELFEAIIDTRQERDYVSTTSLVAKCLRQQSLQRQVPYSEEMKGMWAAFRGTMFHGRLEQYVAPGSIEEGRFHKDLTIDGEVFHLSGSPDLIDPEKGLLYDYKFSKEVPRFDRPWADHVSQCNINRWLVDHCDYMEWRGWKWVPSKDDPRVFVPVEAIDPEAEFPPDTDVLVRPVDWQGLILVYMDDKGTKPLLCQKSIQIPKADGKGTKAARVADIWDDEKAERYVMDHYPEAHDALTLGNVPPPPVGWEYQSHVLCQYCPVRFECAKREREGK